MFNVYLVWSYRIDVYVGSGSGDWSVQVRRAGEPAAPQQPRERGALPQAGRGNHLPPHTRLCYTTITFFIVFLTHALMEDVNSLLRGSVLLMT